MAAKLPIIRIEEAPKSGICYPQPAELIYVLEGAITLTIRHISYPVHENGLFYISSDFPYRLDCDDAVLCRVSFRPGSDNDILNGVSFQLQRASTYSQLCSSAFLDMVMHYQVVRVFDDYCLSSFYQMLYSLRVYLQTAGPVPPGTEPLPSDDRARLLRAYLENNYTLPLTQAETAEKFHLSSSYLSRYFRRAFHTTFTEYLTWLRLSKVASALASTGDSITDIALSNGFANISTFNSAFRKAFRLSPSEYRKTARTSSQRTGDLLLHSLEQLKYSGEVTTSLRLDIRNISECPKPWAALINAGSLSDLTDASLQAALLSSCRELSVRTVRVWNIISPENGMYAYVSDSEDDYSLEPVDRCLDFLVGNGLTPYIDMSYNYDQQLARLYQAVALAGFTSAAEVVSVFRVFLKHVLKRYGRPAVSGWIFGLWFPGEEDTFSFIPEFLKGSGMFECVTGMYRVLKELVPDARTGLAQFGHLYQSENIRKELQRLKAAGLHPDIITCTSYPYVLSETGAEMKFAWTLAAHFVRMELSSLRGALRDTGWGDLPVWLVSYNLNTWVNNVLNDSRFRGAYILENMADIYDQADAAACYTLSDATIAGAKPGRYVDGMPGTIAYSGIRKPAWYALSFLAGTRKHLAAKGNNYFLTVDGTEEGACCQLLLYNPRGLGLNAFQSPEDRLRAADISGYFRDQESLHFSAVLTGFAPGEYRIRILTVDEEHGDIQSWLQKNFTGSGLTEPELIWLRDTCRPSMEIRSAIATANGELPVECTLGPNDFCSIEITPVL